MRNVEAGMQDYSGIYNRAFLQAARERNAEREKIRKSEEAKRAASLKEIRKREEAKRRLDAALLRQEQAERERQNRADAPGREALAAIAGGAPIDNRIRLTARPKFVQSLQVIVARICRALGIQVKEVLSSRRNNEVVFARQAIYYWATRCTTLSTPGIGRMLGGRDHTTVLHGRDAYIAKRAMGYGGRKPRYLRKVR